jgi:hypothetical protein
LAYFKLAVLSVLAAEGWQHHNASSVAEWLHKAPVFCIEIEAAEEIQDGWRLFA